MTNSNPDSKTDHSRYPNSLVTWAFIPPLGIWRPFEEKLFTAQDIEEPVLDLGCGDGQFALAILPEQVYPVGMEPDVNVLSSAAVRSVYRINVCGKAETLPFKDEGFQTVFSNCTIEHIPDTTATLKEIHRVLKKGGRFLFSVPSPYFDNFLRISRFLRWLGLGRIADNYIYWFSEEKLGQIHRQDVDWWVELFNIAGLEMTEYSYYFPDNLMGKFEFMVLFHKIGIGEYNLGNFMSAIFSVLERSGLGFIRNWMCQILYRIIKKDFETTMRNQKGAGLFFIVQKPAETKIIL